MNAVRAALSRGWRLVMTGLCFVLFGVGGLLLSLVWFNLLNLVQRDRARRRRLARRSIAASFRTFLTVARALGVLDYRFDNLDVLRQERGCLVVANHPTLIDYVLIASVMPETDCLVKGALLRNPFLSGAIRASDYLINSEADTLLSACQQRLSQGDTLLIFPEGTRTQAGKAITLQRGAANIAVRCASDLRLVLIHCSEHLLDKQSRWYDIPPNKPFFTVDVRERVNINDFYDAAVQEPALAARQLNRHLQHRLTAGLQSLSGINDASALPGN
ncbi:MULTISPECIES: 1-acyl-sn-glycerol-3-phosphate acyltransferase [unclassified Leclercia]|uniref:1-acyl-sn-glycerol-3-phosphate acyltransferase n=1 Tax=Leclercia barmai TaxID=2785629 RepID=A0ABS7S3Q8_9ENTR|nr:MULTISPECIES: lysophospholipid acyltransferase family protein [unclassified Leclercia]MBZ0060409.1 1-acyl-sn-glycerol-3-phosphate acyltransferase [Leclercia sp. EMC7]MCM5697653.1 1-acyl-sn-glycerol-3-phosphate acyltransferase [Leclercia sp. LTM01]MCM5702194.1 1-acyl-sn-glycerol-3-phosphate acyltransferase [Leclercia sp. LTM14]